MEGKRDTFFLAKKGGKKEPAKKQNDDFKQKRLNNFNKNRVGVENGSETKEKTEKKPFDKKTYRLKKYSKKYKLEQWEEQRKKKLLREYQKTVKNDELSGTYKPVSFDEDAPDSGPEVGKFVRHPDLIEKENTAVPAEKQEKGKKDPFLKAKEQYSKVKEEKMKKQQEIENAREEKKQKLQEYKKKKQDRFRKLSKKTKKGQPVMTGRLELLLDRIQKSK